jgi:hypothetical protein
VNSVRPWNAFKVEITRIFSGPKRSCAKRRASFSAASLASAPELQKKTRSANVASVSLFASRSVGEPVRDVPDLARLLLDRLHHRRVAVAERRHGDAAREVDVHAPVLVPDARALAAHRQERRRREARDHHLVERRASDGQRRASARHGDVAPCRRVDDGLRSRRQRGRGRGHGRRWSAFALRARVFALGAALRAHAGMGTAATIWISTL